MSFIKFKNTAIFPLLPHGSFLLPPWPAFACAAAAMSWVLRGGSFSWARGHAGQSHRVLLERMREKDLLVCTKQHLQTTPRLNARKRQHRENQPLLFCFIRKKHGKMAKKKFQGMFASLVKAECKKAVKAGATHVGASFLRPLPTLFLFFLLNHRHVAPGHRWGHCLSHLLSASL